MTVITSKINQFKHCNLKINARINEKKCEFRTTCLFIKNYVKRLIFIKIFFRNITKINSKIYFINCIYKTNQYRLFLDIIIDVTSLNMIFYVVSYFLFNEKTKNYE